MSSKPEERNDCCNAQKMERLHTPPSVMTRFVGGISGKTADLQGTT
jgi:hypothetical protein